MYYAEDQRAARKSFTAVEADGEIFTQEQTKSGNIFAGAFSPDGKTLAAAGTHKEAHLWNVAEQVLITTLNTQATPIWALAYSPEGRFLAAGSGGKVRVWDMKTQAEVTTLVGFAMPIYSIVFSNDGKRIVAGSLDGTIRFWDTDGFRDD